MFCVVLDLKGGCFGVRFLALVCSRPLGSVFHTVVIM